MSTAWTQGLKVLLLILCGALLQACVPVPANGYSRGSVQNLSGRVLEEIVVGQTTRRQILLKLGEPAAVSETEDAVYYHWDKDYVFGVTSNAAAPLYGKSYRLVITFDARGRVTSREITDKSRFF